jgi:positive regulator of sigma E activity
MRETGCVMSVKGDAAVVAMPMSGECERCGLCTAASGKEVLLLAKNAAEAKEGDTVEIEIVAGRVIAAAFAIYMVPIILTIVGFLIGSKLAGDRADSSLPIVLAVVFLAVSFVAVWLYDLRLRKVERRQAVIVRVLDEEAAEAARRITKVKFGG